MTTAATAQFCRQPRYLRPARSEDRRLCVPALRRVCPCVVCTLRGVRALHCETGSTNARSHLHRQARSGCTRSNSHGLARQVEFVRESRLDRAAQIAFVRCGLRLTADAATTGKDERALRTAGTTVDSAELRCHSPCRPASEQTRFDIIAMCRVARVAVESLVVK
jgi:hypothetical protein